MPYVCTEKYTIETDQKKVAQEHLVKKNPMVIFSNYSILWKS